MVQSPLTVADLRARLKLAGFKGSVRSTHALGPIEHVDQLCAYLRCSSRRPNEVFINTDVTCDHHHLTVDIMDLVNAFKNGDLDQGWNVESDGDASTGILTREAAYRTGIPSSQWASNPYRAS